MDPRFQTMDRRLQQAINNDSVEELHVFIREEPRLIDCASKGPFTKTPLHFAAAEDKTLVAMEMAILKPLLARKLDTEGYSPMHLALRNRSYRTVRALMTPDPELIRVRGQFGMTHLHYVAETAGAIELELLAEFLSACPSSIQDLTSRCDTVVHVAVKDCNLGAFRVLLGSIRQLYMKEIMDWKNEEGNTILHIAVSGEQQPEV